MPQEIRSFTILNARCIVDSIGDTRMILRAMETVWLVRIDPCCQENI